MLAAQTGRLMRRMLEMESFCKENGGSLMQQKNFIPCPSGLTLRVVGGKWKAPILLSLHEAHRPLRFTEIKRALPGITPRMLSRRLRELEAQGILSRNIRQVKPPRVEYAMTEHGSTLHAVLVALSRWGKANGWSE